MKGSTDNRKEVIWFDLELLDIYRDWIGRLEIEWPGKERSWWRWANRNQFQIYAIHDHSRFNAEMPPWTELVLSWHELSVLPASWKAKLREWRGIYFIHDQSDGKGYVGSAYSSENILGRWQNYADRGHGGNKLLKKRQPEHFEFSILQRVSPDMEATEVINLESSWKKRLHSIDHGLNEK